MPLIDVDVSTSNTIFSLFVGPELRVPRGAVRPYVTGQLGFSYFSTESSVAGSDNTNAFAETTNFEDLTFAGPADVGVRIPVTRGLKPISLAIGVRYVWNGEAEYCARAASRSSAIRRCSARSGARRICWATTSA